MLTPLNELLNHVKDALAYFPDEITDDYECGKRDAWKATKEFIEELLYKEKQTIITAYRAGLNDGIDAEHGSLPKYQDAIFYFAETFDNED